ncbi:MAG: branched-chain amino acid ABC transporter permease [Dethiobacteria bacterium]|nr:branched-chain amino acid ABC transporter permease [Bacillota bacterium]HQD05426.1 branched-chain amino acid ABC transporter permease [Bacillota bacterium]
MISPYYLQLIILVGINTIMALSLNLIIGYTGQLSIGHAAFMSLGAYCSALLTLHFNLPFIVSLLGGALFAAFFGILIGIPTLKLKGDYLAIATLGFGEIVRIVCLNLEITGGAVGLRGIPKKTTLLWVVLAVLITAFILNRIIKSRIGRALIAIREDETAADAMGINSTYYKILCFGVGAFFAGLGGGLFAHYMRFLHPKSFDFMKSIEQLCMVVLGGLGNMWGSFVGATILTVVPEMLRSVADLRLLIYGAVLILMMRVRPQGILGESPANGGFKNNSYSQWIQTRLKKSLRKRSGSDKT